MKPVLIYARPFSLTAMTRVDVRIADGGAAADYAVGGFQWEPVVTTRPQQSIELFTLTLDGKVQTGKCSFAFNPRQIRAVPNAENLYWDGAPIVINCEGPLEGPTAIPEFVGRVESSLFDKDRGIITINASVSDNLIDCNLLTLSFNGDGASGGAATKKGTWRPAGFGTVYNIEPVWFDLTRNIGQVDGYGNTLGIDWLGEGLSSFGASVGDYATYAALAAAIDAHAVPPGRWATCIAEGLVGLGAPPTGVITCHARFGFTKSGAWMQRILQIHAGIDTSLIDTASFTALDTAVNRPIGYWTADQRNVKDLLQAIARGANATPIITFQGKVAVTRIATTGAAFSLDRAGGGAPRVLSWRPGAPSAPFYKLFARAARPARVLTFGEVNYVDTILPRGLYNSATVYRAGNTIETIDGTGYLFINATPSSGHLPPTGTLPPAAPAADAYWQQVSPPAYTDRGDFVLGRTYYQGNIVSLSDGSRYLFINSGSDNANAPPNATYWQLYTGQTNAQIVGGRSSSAILATIDAAASDNVLSTGEKDQIIRDFNQVQSQYARAIDQYGILASPVELSTQVTNATNNLTALNTYLGGLTPAWNDVSQNTPISGPTLRSTWNAAVNYVEILSSAIAAYNTSQTEFFDSFNYATETDFRNAWEVAGAFGGRTSIVSVTDGGGRAVQIGNNTDGSDYAAIFANKWLPYSPEDLFRLDWDIDIQAAGPGAVVSLGVAAMDRAGNNLGYSYCYVAAAGVGEQANTGRRTYSAWMRGIASGANGAAGQGSTQANPVPLPDGSDFAFGQGGTVRIRAMALIHYPVSGTTGPNNKGKTLLRSCGLRKAKDTTVNPTGNWSSTRTYFPDDAVRSAEGRLFYAKVKNTNQAPATTAADNAYWAFYLDRGTDGANAVTISLTATSSVFKYDKDNSPYALTNVFQAHRQNTSAQTIFNVYDSAGTLIYSGNAAAYAGTGVFTYVDADTISMSQAQFAAFIAGNPARENFTVSAYIQFTSNFDAVDVHKVKDGADGAGFFTLVAQGNAVVTPTTITKVTTSGWDGSGRSLEGFTGDVMAIARLDTISDAMLALNTNPGDDASYPSLDYAGYFNSHNFYIYESGGSTGVPVGTWADGDFAYVARRGTTIEYGILGLDPFHVTTGVDPSVKLYFDSSMAAVGQRFTNVSFGPVGQDGNYRDTKFYQSNAMPATPTAANPVGWTDAPGTGTETVWQIWALKRADGSLIGVWSTPRTSSGINRRTEGYSPSLTYYINNVIAYNGGSYIAVQDNFSGHAPSGTTSANAWWDVFSAPGAAGAPATPPSGFSATIPLTSGAAVNLYDAAVAAGYTGHSDATINFTVPNAVLIRGLAGGLGLDTGSFPWGSYTIALTLTVQNGGAVEGGGGNGGSMGAGGGTGGTAIYLRGPLSGGIIINAGGAVRSGGGGGACRGVTSSGKLGGGGGGGGAPNGEGGDPSEGSISTGNPGIGGSPGGGGAGGTPGGGAGGAYGTAGSNASDGTPGGSPGAAIAKNGYAAAVTNNGTLTGAVVA
jgi:hypothetical protein